MNDLSKDGNKFAFAVEVLLLLALLTALMLWPLPAVSSAPGAATKNAANRAVR
jgi:hypothetical protein